MSDIVANGNMNLDKEKRERIRKGKIDYRNAIFYNKMTNEYKTAIRILDCIYMNPIKHLLNNIRSNQL